MMELPELKGERSRGWRTHDSAALVTHAWVRV